MIFCPKYPIQKSQNTKHVKRWETVTPWLKEKTAVRNRPLKWINRQKSWSNYYEHVHGLNEPIRNLRETIKTNENSITENYKIRN